ncbi:tRNA nucleotidyltransferase (CCA-adding enzyme) [Desulfocicer vacuolatum DSM 3385]|uniref:tRNA nucleotidyltransferase (CCA-adding enzyme) n=1 Tax=Desulfocicer vacuolatum DSM 3385 TaxID=1121400 RepID=A0A1W1ZLH0_9BACT|nr:CBS domain-containing protein [Desulfocicer vacuolatum]SMC49395.1 tRNA nucleotidyltransferase (CCA-adding enzyme) [Desulfocicer vacuolatum DSM 3385]
MKKEKKIQPEAIITSHINADFDAISSMLAAQKLYPEAVVIFPGSQEKNLRDFFVSTMSYLFNMENPKNIDFSLIRKLIVVDTRRPLRIPAVAKLLEKEELEIHIYDHHPDKEGDIKADISVVQPTGATVTILTQLIREKSIAISPEEATVMALGIYEDTGSFTYTSTTEADLQATAFLLSCGANLNTISDFISKEIRTDQVAWLNELINEKVSHTINGVEIHISTISSPEYIPDLAAIVQMVMKIDNLDVFFAIVLMEAKVNVIARSRIIEVNVGEILSALGGGGHASAASAGIPGKTLAQVEQELIELLKSHVMPTRIAQELMSTPAFTIKESVTCRDAGMMMTRCNVNALLVSSDDPHEITGYITRHVIEKTGYHQLGHLPVSEYMSTEITTISQNAGLMEIESRIMGEKQRLLPVKADSRVIGVITRTDLLNYLVHRNKNGTGSHHGQNITPQHAKQRNIGHLITERLTPAMADLLREIGRAGDELGVNLFVVGGFVRDLLLCRKSDDIDVVVEGDGIDFARRFILKKGGRCNTHREFCTAVMVLPNGFKIDVASARMEYYTAPAALPTVEMSSIQRDLFRRDFTINTLAVGLNKKNFGTLIDFFGAQRDLKDKTIRTLHNLSFVEDPTRVFRAIKFANRFDFTIGKLTLSLIRNAVKFDFFRKLSGRRLFSELKQILEEENPIPAIESLRNYHLEKVIHPDLIMDDSIIETLGAAQKAVSWHDLLYLNTPCMNWSIYFMVILKKCPYQVVKEICSHLRLSPSQTKLILRDRLKAEERLYILERRFPPTNSGLYALLNIFKPEHLLYIMACTRIDRVRKAVSFYYTRLKDIKPTIQGRDLIALNLKPGRTFQAILQSVLDAKLDGKLKNKKEEIAFVQKHHMPVNPDSMDKSVD